MKRTQKKPPQSGISPLQSKLNEYDDFRGINGVEKRIAAAMKLPNLPATPRSTAIIIDGKKSWMGLSVEIQFVSESGLICYIADPLRGFYQWYPTQLLKVITNPTPKL